jgi:hypothetical protein
VSAIVTQQSTKVNIINDLDQQSSHQDLESSTLLMDDFGPTTFASSNEIAEDEENDAKLWIDVVESIRQWQQNKYLKHRRREAGNYR